MGCGCSSEKPGGFRHSTTLIENSKIADFREKFEFISMLGNGSFGKVRLYRDRKCKDLKFAIKTLKKEILKKETLSYLKQEIKIIQDLDHPNIVKYFETYEDDMFIHIVMEYIPGDDLFKVISQKKFNNYTEKDVCEIIQNLLRAILFLHNKNIVHRDLKPQNILFSTPGKYISLKLIDFGLSTKEIGPGKYVVGSPYYMAPEIINGNSELKSDMWSVGIILYTLLTGRRPFESSNQNDLFSLIQNGVYNVKLLDDQKVSPEVKDLTKKLILVNVEKRLSTHDALQHPWFKKFLDSNKESCIDNSILNSLRLFTEANLFEKEVLFYLAKISKDEEILNLKKAFMEVDKDNTGTIEFEEILQAFKLAGIEPKETEARNIWDNLDFHHDGTVNYSEFLAATLNTVEFFREEKLWTVFNYFDVDKEGYITALSVTNALKHNNLTVNEKEIFRLFKSFKEDANYKMNFDEFKKLMIEDSNSYSRRNSKMKSQMKLQNSLSSPAKIHNPNEVNLLINKQNEKI